MKDLSQKVTLTMNRSKHLTVKGLVGKPKICIINISKTRRRKRQIPSWIWGRTSLSAQTHPPACQGVALGGDIAHLNQKSSALQTVKLPSTNCVSPQSKACCR